MTYLLGGVLWWLLQRLHPCGIDVPADMLDFDAIIREES
jgi:hypothetical protein